MSVRIESDSLGAVEVPADALFGVHTVRAVGNFALPGPRLGDRPELVVALAQVKVAAARANARFGALDARLAEAIVVAAREIADRRWDEQFPVPLVQGGGGTSANMNVNEVIANRANELLGGARGDYRPVHPNDHVNRSQSTNDVVPTAVQLALIRAGESTLAGLDHLHQTLRRKAIEQGQLVHLGRTCLQDAIPLTVAQTHGGQASGVARTAAGLGSALAELRHVPLGATVIGTGFGAPAGFAVAVVDLLAGETGLELSPSTDPFDALAHFDPYLAVAHALERAMLVMAKIASDVRLLASGPVGGLGELTLPALQAGSAAMPGKVNPVLPELVLQVAYDVRGTVATVAAAVAGGELELNVMEPVIARRLLESLDSVAAVARLFADRCLAGLAWNEAVVAANLAGSLAAAMEDAAAHGYTAAAERVKQERRP